MCANGVVVELSIGNCKTAREKPLLYDTRILENALSLGNPLIIMKYGTQLPSGSCYLFVPFDRLTDLRCC